MAAPPRAERLLAPFSSACRLVGGLRLLQAAAAASASVFSCFFSSSWRLRSLFGVLLRAPASRFARSASSLSWRARSARGLLVGDASASLLLSARASRQSLLLARLRQRPSLLREPACRLAPFRLDPASAVTGARRRRGAFGAGLRRGGRSAASRGRRRRPGCGVIGAGRVLRRALRRRRGRRRRGLAAARRGCLAHRIARRTGVRLRLRQRFVGASRYGSKRRQPLRHARSNRGGRCAA